MTNFEKKCEGDGYGHRTFASEKLREKFFEAIQFWKASYRSFVITLMLIKKKGGLDGLWEMDPPSLMAAGEAWGSPHLRKSLEDQ